jgi:hypothetical protein
MGAMRSLLCGFTCLTLAAGWAARADPEGALRARCMAVQTRAAIDVLEDLERAAGPSIDGAPNGVALGAGAEERSAAVATWAWPWYDADARIPCDVVIMDGETGTPVHLEPEAVLARAEGLDSPELPRPSDSPDAPLRGPPAEVPWVPGSSYATPCTPVNLAVTISAPDGYVADTGSYGGGAQVSRRARRLRLLAPLRREADVWVRVLDAAGGPVKGASATSAYLAGPEPRVVNCSPDEIPECGELDGVVESDTTKTIRCASEPTGEDGWTRARGIPHFLGERFWIIAGDGEREGFTGITLGGFGGRYDAEVRLRDEPSKVWRDLAYSVCGGSG